MTRAPDRMGSSGSATAQIGTLLSTASMTSPPTSAAGAAVLIVLREGRHEVETLLIERAVREGDRASGQVALPGGRVDPGDPDLRATAVRELGEEVGLLSADLNGPPRYVSTETATAFSMRVAVFATELAPKSRAPHARSPTEVAHVFWLPRAALDRTERLERDTLLGPREVDASVYSGHVLWGFTRRVLRSFFGMETPDPFGPPESPVPPASPGTRETIGADR